MGDTRPLAHAARGGPEGRLRAGRLAVGLGYRGALHDALLAVPSHALDFLEVAPENLVMMGGGRRARFDAVAGRWPVVTHGLSLSLGGPAPLDRENLEQLARFSHEVGTPWYSDHLAVTSDAARQAHELLPVEMSGASARRVAARVREAANALGLPFAVENVSAYGRRAADTLDEADFVAEVVDRSAGWLLLDVNNLVVNAANSGPLTGSTGELFDRAMHALERLPLSRVLQIHIAGHHVRDDGLRIDTHGEAVDDVVYAVLGEALRRTGPVPVLLERDHGLEVGLEPLLGEIAMIRAIGDRLCPGSAPDVVPAYDLPLLEPGAGMAPLESRPTRDPLLDAVFAPDAAGDAVALRPPAALDVYRELVTNNLEAVIANALPLTRSRLGEAPFAELVRRFLAEAGAQHPWYREVPGDFVVWAEETDHPLRTLIRWEWLELVALRHPADVLSWRDEMSGGVALSPNPTLQALVAPLTLDALGGHVQKAGAEEDPIEAVYLVWRAEDEGPRFQRVDLVTGQALALAAETPAPLHTIARALAAHHGLDARTLEGHLAATLGPVIERGGALVGRTLTANPELPHA